MFGIAIVSAPGVSFGAVGAAGAFIEGLGALEQFDSSPPPPTFLSCTPIYNYGSYFDWQPLPLAASATYLYVSMLMSLGFLKKIAKNGLTSKLPF